MPHPRSERACHRAQRLLAAHGSEAVMLRDTPARCDRDAGGSRRASILELLTCIRGGTCVAVVVGLLACFGWEGLWASAVPKRLPVHLDERSARAVPHRLTIHPDGATVAVNQTQRFGVTDAQGRSVAVHWNVSGLGCSGLACGTIDDQGVYRTPSSLPKPRVVTLEGVLVSDPNYSVLTQIRLEDAITLPVSPTSAQVSAGEKQQFTAPVVGRQNVASRAELPPLPHAVAAAPAVGTQIVASRAKLPPLPHAIAAAPAVGTQIVASRTELPPLPHAVAAAPPVGTQIVASRAELPPLPHAVAAAPPVGTQIVASRAELPPLPHAVAAAPPVGTQIVASRAELPPLPHAVAAAPAVGIQIVAGRAELPPLPHAVAAVNPTSAAVSTVKTQQFTATAVGRQNVARSAVLLPLPDEVAAAPVGTVVSLQRSPVVTYRDGQLTIDAQNSTLAEVLKLVAEKTGAVIEVPPGSGLERIVEHAGPGKPNDILSQLLNGSHFNFVIVNSPQNPNALAQVLLSLQQDGPPKPDAAPTSSTLASAWKKPPEPDPTARPLPPPIDVKLPTEQLSPDQRGDFMRQMFKELREKIQQQNPQQNPPQ